MAEEKTSLLTMIERRKGKHKNNFFGGQIEQEFIHSYKQRNIIFPIKIQAADWFLSTVSAGKGILYSGE